ncbi:MAG TPA: sulfite exporter TauE/SafE family protein [Thermoanaerobaculia bacterium]|nr:sulfite exporter TauE/SafE family protein [Thermoanaerobaculia bacterium]
MTPLQEAALVGSALGAGLMNSVAGGGTLLTFPALLFLGENAITANATSTVALLPAAIGSMAGYRSEIATHKEWLRRLLLPSIVGGAAGSLLLLATPEQTFRTLAPYLVLFATLLFTAQALRKTDPAKKPHPRSLAIAVFAQLLVAVYGGYFGAGIGILMLVILGFLGLTDIHAMNGLKNFFGLCINFVAAALFVVRGAVEWRPALLMMLGAIAGGYAGARVAKRVGQKKARWAVIVIGAGITVALLLSPR